MEFLRPGAHVHLIGICGTAMASLAGMLQEDGYRVTGSDSGVYPPMSTQLAALGIAAQEGYDAARLDPAPDLVVIGNALSRGNPEVEETLNRGLRYESMAVVVKELYLRGRGSLAVAGTHGKTTTTSLLAWILECAGRRPGFLIGGVAGNFSASFRRPADSGCFVIEGDEYDTAFFDKGPKFLHYLPRAVILTSVEFDHADIYRDLGEVKTAFRRLVNLVPGNGVIVAWAGSAAVRECLSRAFCPVITYGLSASDWTARELRADEAGTRFEIWRGSERLVEARTVMSGEHNALNALGACALASHYGVAPEVLAQALATFQGVKRRLEVRGEMNGVAVVDDFAHHPTAIQETLRAARARFPGRRLWAVLEPRSNTLRRRVFERELVQALALADRVVVAAVHRPEAIPEPERLDAARVAEALQAQRKPASYLAAPGEILDAITPQLQPGDVVVIMSNGGFGGIHEALLLRLQQQGAGGTA
jgi:UDP-N-acetylmuramate: L-alanyl-gamma-D-glutamyl-meso-diaminopimelate ligase